MPGRILSLSLLLVLAAGGCATVSEDRIAMLESAVMDIQARDMRLAALEDTVAELIAKPSFPSTGSTQDPQTQPVPRAVPVAPEPGPGTALVNAAPRPVSASAPVANPPAPAKSANPAQRYRTALATLEAGQTQAALGLFREFLAEFPEHALAPNAGYWLGECHYTLKQYDSAVMAFNDVVAQHPSHDKAAASMLKAGYSYALLGDKASARFYLEALIRDFPSSQPASLARARLATL